MSEITEMYDEWSVDNLKYISYSLNDIDDFDRLIKFFQFAKDNGYSNTKVTSFSIECSKSLTEEEVILEDIRITEYRIKRNQEYLIELKSKLCTK
jgi:hypothetical protein